MIYPRTFSHVGLTVPNIYDALEFYSSIMGWHVTTPVTTTKEEHDTPISSMYRELFGPGYKEFKYAHLSTRDRVGVELFEFHDKNKQKKTLPPEKSGVFHYCVQDPDIEGLVYRILKAGGKQCSAMTYHQIRNTSYRMVYMEDPFGNIVEIHSQPYEPRAISKNLQIN